ncbi:SMP-30/gluconolactonase/LRE family protein [Maribacter algarum]|uniref:SMP-30/gluconolactonase/LRE family protein n=1 Tax=Maribacter algarum (ex Zhang et al. 2020) TaxID=2578118 RepID=A0A5S3QM95_9FLAO|nr:SMP-30/gluconolactonase/LRE family protein [Maribacter algarum]TMM59014.1 SMP-30/gluconolactonase/LRE family protein [Maribacter algarum]
MSKIIFNKANLLLNAKATLGEGPVWDWKKQQLFWVDIEACKLHSHNPSNGKNQEWAFDEMIGAAVPTTSGKMLLALESGLATFDLEKGKLIRHYLLENNDSSMRFNDGKVGPNGDFWIGSMHKKFIQKTGNLYCVAPNFETSIKIPKTTISNGMAWTSDHKKFYFIDSPTHQIRSYNFNVVTSQLSNNEITIKIPESFGLPDGMCIDTEDMLWIAHWGGSCVRRWNPKTGQVMEQINVSVPHVTSCCFGGEDFKTLYITTARSGLSDEQVKKFPLSGGLFTYRAKVVGKQITYFKN